MANITFEVVPLRAYLPFPALLPFLNASQKSCSVRMFSTACYSDRSPQLCHNGGLSFLSSTEGTGKSKVDGGRQSFCFWSKFPGENGSVRRRVVVKQQPVLLSPTYRAKYSLILRSRLKTSQEYAELTV
jgi:hypothetical protein